MAKKIGIRREDKAFELRTPIVPADVKGLIRQHGFEFVIEPSEQRIYKEEAYKEVGASVGDLKGSPDPSVIFGIKEIPKDVFEAEKVYLFFAHVIKGQPYNMAMLQQMLDVGATLIDYERIVEVDSGRRLVFFGNWAGYAGMAETLRGLGERLKVQGIAPNPFADLQATHEYDGLDDLQEAIETVGERIKSEGLASELAPFCVGFIGYGNTSRGAQAIFDLLPHKIVTPQELVSLPSDNHLLYKIVFREEDTVRPKDPSIPFELQHYYNHGKAQYESNFFQYLPYLTILMNCIYWTDKYPRMVTKTELKQLWEQTRGKPHLKIVGDISCDIGGAIEFTLDCTKPDKPIFVFDPVSEEMQLGIKGRGVAVMAVDNLPTELPREASTSFSETLRQFIPPIVKADYTVPFEELDLPPEVKKAVIVYQGKLTPEYEYLKKYL
jgi:saccharopine dehydrogenase (NAD+, L-lysine-forming)